MKHPFCLFAGTDMNVMNRHANGGQETMISRGGMVLPFQPLSLAFDHVNYYVDMPPVSLLILLSLLRVPYGASC